MPRIGHPVAVEQKAALGQVDAEIGVDEHEQARLPGAFHQRLGMGQHLFGAVRGQHHELHVEAPGARQRGRQHGKGGEAGHLGEPLKSHGQHFPGTQFTLVEVDKLHAAEAGVGQYHLPHPAAARQALHGVHHVGHVALGVLEGGLRRRRVGDVHLALVFRGRQFLLRHHEEGHGQQGEEDGTEKHRPVVCQQALEQPAVALPGIVEHPVHPPRHARLAALLRGHPAAHHRREGQRHHAGNEHRYGQRERELLEQHARHAGQEADWDIDHGERHGHGHDGRCQLPGAGQRRRRSGRALAHVPGHVLYHHDGIVHHQAHRQHDGQNRQQVERKAHQRHGRHRAEQGNGNGHQGHQRRSHRAHHDHHHQAHEHDRFRQGREYLGKRITHVNRDVLADLEFEAGRHVGVDLVDGHVQRIGDIDFVGPRKRIDTQPHGVVMVHPPEHRAFFLAELDAGNVAHPYQRTLGLADDHAFELFRPGQRSVHQQVDALVGVLGLPDGGDDVVARKRRLDVLGADVEHRHALRVEPDAHGRQAAAAHPDLEHSGNRRQLRRHLPAQVVGHLGAAHALVEPNAQVPARKRPVGALHFHRRILRPGRQLETNLAEPGGEFGQRIGAVFIELEVDRHHASARAGFRLGEVDAGNGGGDPLNGIGDETLHHVRGSADIGCRHHQGGALDGGILLHRHVDGHPHADEGKAQAQRRRQYRAAHEQVREARLGGALAEIRSRHGAPRLRRKRRKAFSYRVRRHAAPHCPRRVPAGPLRLQAPRRAA